MRQTYRKGMRLRRKGRFPNLGWLGVVSLIVFCVVFWPGIRVLLKLGFDGAQIQSQRIASEMFGDWLPSLKQANRKVTLELFQDLILLPGVAPLDSLNWKIMIPQDFLDAETASSSSVGVDTGIATAGPEIDKQHFRGAAVEFREPLLLDSFQLNFHGLPETRDSGLWRIRALPGDHGTGQDVRSLSSADQKTSLQLGHVAEVLEFEAIVLSPGESILLSAADMDSPTFLSRYGSLDVICLGATADRLDAPGLFKLQSFSFNDQVGKNILGQVKQVEVSHRRERVNVTIPVSESQPVAGWILTWSEDASGTLLILGTRNRAQPLADTSHRKPKREGAARLLVTTSEIADVSNFLPVFQESMKRRKDISFHEEPFVWPTQADRVQNESEMLQLISQSVLQDSLAWHRVEVVPGRHISDKEARGGVLDVKSLSSLGLRSRFVVAAETFLQDRIAMENIWGSLLRNWEPLMFHFVDLPESRELREDFVANRLEDVFFGSGITLSKIRSLSIFDDSDDWVNGHLEVKATLMDQLLSILSENVHDLALETLVHVSKVVLRESDHVILMDDRIPDKFKPGWGFLYQVQGGVEQKFASQSHPMGLAQSHFIEAFFGQLNNRENPRQDPKQLNSLVARIAGDSSKFYVFESGWIYLPSPSDRLSDSEMTEPIYGLPLSQLSSAKKEIFNAESHSRKLLLQFRVPLPHSVAEQGSGGRFMLDLRSEYPVFGCSASVPNVSFRSSFSVSDGWMFVKADYDASSLNGISPEKQALEGACLVEIGKSNPIPKKKVSDNSEDAEAGKAISLTVRASWNGNRIPLSEMRLGPYLEPADLMMSPRAVDSGSLRVDLRDDAQRLTRIVPLELNKNGQSQLEFWLSASDDLPSSHPYAQRWDDEVNQFIANRLEYSQSIRESRF